MNGSIGQEHKNRQLEHRILDWKSAGAGRCNGEKKSQDTRHPGNEMERQERMTSWRRIQGILRGRDNMKEWCRNNFASGVTTECNQSSKSW